MLREYVWLDGRPLTVIEGGQTYWLHWDQIGRPVMATDSTGTVVWAASYLPFGGIRAVSVDTGALTQDLRFPGQWFQAETGLHKNWHRDYDPTTGRYLQADPLGLVDGPSVYGYARQSPVRFVDPTGEFIPVPIMIAGALVGGLSNAGFQFLVNLDDTGDMMTALRCIDIGKVVASAAFGAIQFTPLQIYKQGGGIVMAGLGAGVTTAYKMTQFPPARIGSECECGQQKSTVKEIIRNIHL